MALSALRHTRRVLAVAGSFIAAGSFAFASQAVAVPDATPPNAFFATWTESTPWAYHNPSDNPNRIWFNPMQPASVTASIKAADPESGIAHVSWPTPPTGWTPGAGLGTSPLVKPGIAGEYFENIQNNTYPGGNFTGASVSRLDPDIAFAWGTGTPHPVDRSYTTSRALDRPYRAS